MNVLSSLQAAFLLPTPTGFEYILPLSLLLGASIGQYAARHLFSNISRVKSSIYLIVGTIVSVLLLIVFVDRYIWEFDDGTPEKRTLVFPIAHSRFLDSYDYNGPNGQRSYEVVMSAIEDHDRAWMIITVLIYFLLLMVCMTLVASIVTSVGTSCVASLRRLVALRRTGGRS